MKKIPADMAAVDGMVRTQAISSSCRMDQAVRAVIGDALQIRLDKDMHKPGELWIEEKGEKFYKLLSPYLSDLLTDSDKKKWLLENIYAPW